MSGWYVMQVMSGRETDICTRCQCRMADGIYSDMFIPKYVRKKRYQGQWHDEIAILFPGYIFVETEHINKLVEELWCIDSMTHMLHSADMIMPITGEEQSYLQSIMNEQYIVELSTGYIIGEQIEIISGPLRHCQAKICRVDRHKRIAELDVSIYGRYTRAQVGLEIIEKKQ